MRSDSQTVECPGVSRDSVRTRTGRDHGPDTYEPATKRFELRLTASRLARWRTFAADQGAKLADVVRVAMEQALAQMPPGHVAEVLEREASARMAAVQTLLNVKESVRTEPSSAALRDETESMPSSWDDSEGGGW